MSKLVVLSVLSALGLNTIAYSAPRRERKKPVGISDCTSLKKSFLSTDCGATLKDQGVNFFFSDVPVNQKVNANDLSKLSGETLLEKLTSEIVEADGVSQYQLRQVYDANKEAKGQAVGYHNRSDDVDTNFEIKVSDDGFRKLKPNTVYQISAKLSFYTSVSSASFGVGGSADSNAFGLLVSPNPFTVKSVSESLAAGPKDQLGLPASFFIDASEIPTYAEEMIDTISGPELEILLAKINPQPEDSDEMRAAGIKVLTSLFEGLLKKTLTADDALSLKIVQVIDAKVEELIQNLSPEDLESIKASAGEGSGPVMTLASASASGSSYFRTFTKNEEMRDVRVGVPSGTCGRSADDLTQDEKWICSRYSYMGRINKGESTAQGWAHNSIATQKPVEIKTDSKGNPVYVNLQSHSGFEGLTLFYVTGIELTVTEKK